jgi:proteasome-associated ATPase
MARKNQPQTDAEAALANLGIALRSPISTEEKVQIAHALRGGSEEMDRRVVECLVVETASLYSSLERSSAAQKELRRIAERVTAPPYHAAVFVGPARTSRGDGAVVWYGSSRRVVTLAEEIAPGAFAPGDEVLLGPELNTLVGKLDPRVQGGGETAVFDRVTSDGRVVVRYREEELILTASGALDLRAVRAGDLLRWDRALWMAFETLQRSEGTHLFLEDTPSETFDEIGGLRKQIERLKNCIRLKRDHAAVANKYGVVRKGGILLCGPPGTGKTMLARAFASWLASVSSSGRSRFMNIKPGALHSMWYSQSEANYREAFRVAREAGEAEPTVPVVLFFDEVDAIGATRGQDHGAIHDKVLLAFMAELDGLARRGNVVVIGATNRADALDVGLVRPGRLGDEIVNVPRPDRRAAREILSLHLGPRVPFADDGGRETAIESVLSRIYAPNGGTEIATLTFRDGSRRTLTARDVVSGAVLARIARDTAERACLREIETGEEGVRLTDLFRAVDGEVDRIAAVLSPANCRSHVDDLPQDLGVVSVERIRRQVRRPHDYVRAA